MSFFKKWLSRGNKNKEAERNERQATPEVPPEVTPEGTPGLSPQVSPQVSSEVPPEAEVGQEPEPEPEPKMKKKPQKKKPVEREYKPIQRYVSPDEFVRRNKEWDERRDSRRTSVAPGESRDWSRNGSFSYGAASNMGWVHPPWM